MKDAVAVVIKKGNKYLLIRRAKQGRAEDYWCPVTGAVEEGEAQEQAVAREAKEEMGIDVEPVSKVWECLTDDKEYLLHWWHAKLVSAEVDPDPAEVKESGWFTITQMDNLNQMFDADRIFFEQVAPALPDS
ncbi:NUDIX hydrolase [candidate division WOR-3 bacterium]|nr:NUDIX hydrolase [candidate division WOR-3 bacterium]